MTRAGIALGLVASAASALAPVASPAQTVEGLATACVLAGGDATICAATALAGRELMGDLAALAGPGSEVAGESSTLGRRLGGAPRLAAHFRVAGLSAGFWDPSDGTGTTRASAFVPSLQAGVGLGLFDGLQLLPTMGGFLSVDIIGHATYAFFPRSEGFTGRVDTYALGARIGLLRESFTLPGVSVSLVRRYAGALRLGPATAGAPGEVLIDPSITSYRATVGKDLFAIGVVAGVAWDDHGTDARISAPGGAGSATASGRLEAGRGSYFVGLSRQIGVLAWVTLELGLLPDFGSVAGLSPSVPQPDGRSVAGSLAFLLKL